MSKFTTAFRELGTYKELLRSQVLISYNIYIYRNELPCMTVFELGDPSLP
jgi:hypothetical protein